MSAPSETGAAAQAGPARRKHQGEAPEGSREALRVASCVLEVLAGVCRPADAASALGVSLARYYQLEQRALAGLVAGCEPLRRGRGASSGPELQRLRHENERLARECQRQQALVRLARQAAGLTAPPDAPPSGKKRRRRSARGQEAAQRMRRKADSPAADAEGQPAAAGGSGPQGHGEQEACAKPVVKASRLHFAAETAAPRQEL